MTHHTPLKRPLTVAEASIMLTEAEHVMAQLGHGHARNGQPKFMAAAYAGADQLDRFRGEVEALTWLPEDVADQVAILATIGHLCGAAVRRTGVTLAPTEARAVDALKNSGYLVEEHQGHIVSLYLADYARELR